MLYFYSAIENARAYAADVGTNVILIDDSQLAKLMMDHDVGVSEVSSYTIKKIGTDYFIDEIDKYKSRGGILNYDNGPGYS